MGSATPRDSLGALLEESTPTSSTASPQLGAELEDSGEPIPSLASLLLSTAESLATRSKALNSANSSAPAPKAKPPPAFASVANPGALLANPASKEYLASLLALPLPTLLALPNQLATLSTSLDTDLSSLAFTRYSSFLLAHAATQSISTSFSTLSANLNSFIESTDALKNVVGGFEQRVSEPRRKRERMALVRERMEEVEELMEAPSVVDACVRAGYWAEAIDVALRLSDLHKRLATSASRASSDGEGVGALLLLERVREEVSVALLSLRARVLDSLLQRGLKLPGAVRGVSILRRIGERGFGMLDEGATSKELDEDALRIVFLAARWRCLRGELESVEGQMAASGIKLADTEARPSQQQREDSDAQVGAEENEERTRWTKRWIEVWREIVGETVGMFTEVFLSSTPLSNAASSSAPHALPSTAPLALFLTTALTSLSDILSYAIPSLTSPSSLSSLLTQLSYCSHSFARHGLEFRELQQLRERVEARVGRIVVVEWEMAGRKWEKEWRDGWEGSPSSTSAANSRRNHLLGGRPPISDWLVSPEGLAQVFATPLPPAVDLKAPPPTWHHQPSQPLALLPPLARFLNAHATALNALRLLPPLALYPSFLAAQARELDRATQVLAAFTDAWLASLSTLPAIDLSISEDELSKEELQLRQLREDEKQLVIFAVAAFGRWVVPWCEGGLKKGVYGELSQKGMGKEEREQGVVDAIRRAEGIVARIEGRPVVASPSPPSINEMPPTLDLRLNGDSELPPSERSIDVVTSPSSDVAPIPFDPSPLDEAEVDPAIVEASIVVDDHVPEEEPPAIDQVEEDALPDESVASPSAPTEPLPPPSFATSEPEPAPVASEPPVQDEPAADDIDHLVASEAPTAEPFVKEEEEEEEEEPVAEEPTPEPIFPSEEPLVVEPVVEEAPVEPPAPVEEEQPKQTIAGQSSAAVPEPIPSPLVDEALVPTIPEPALAEEEILDAPIEDLDVDKMPLDHPPTELLSPKASEELQREEPEVEIAIEEPSVEVVATVDEVEQEEPAVTSEGMEAGEVEETVEVDEEENDEDDAWGI